MAFTFSGDDVCQITFPTPLPAPYWVALLPSCAKLIGLTLYENDLPEDKKWLKVLSRNQLNTANHQFARHISTAYSGHQFGVWAWQLGDGRAVLRSSIREFLCSEGRCTH